VAMQMVPLFLVDDMPGAVDFYTRILDFDLAWRSPDGLIASLCRGEAELMLTGMPTDQVARVNAHLMVEDADALFARWTARGLDQSHRTESPVHLGVVDQSWGTREFYVTDPSGNTLRIVQRAA
jgi:catechol 2,3-dioxygenase-like lactoylglutathione lyase family enzyme